MKKVTFKSFAVGSMSALVLLAHGAQAQQQPPAPREQQQCGQHQQLPQAVYDWMPQVEAVAAYIPRMIEKTVALKAGESASRQVPFVAGECTLRTIQVFCESPQGPLGQCQQQQQPGVEIQILCGAQSLVIGHELFTCN